MFNHCHVKPFKVPKFKLFMFIFKQNIHDGMNQSINLELQLLVIFIFQYSNDYSADSLRNKK